MEYISSLLQVIEITPEIATHTNSSIHTLHLFSYILVCNARL